MTADAAALPRCAAARLPDWPARLAALVARRMQQPLQWGVHDCCLWAADVVQAVTGVDLAADLRGTYATEAGAQAALQAHGGLVQLCISRLGRVAPPALAQPGDVGLAVVAGVPLLAANGGPWLAVGRAGLVVVPDAQVLRAWRCCAEGGHG